MKTKILITLFILSTITFGQSFQTQQTKLLAYNALFGGITSGIGACFNKEKNDKLGQTFLNGFWKGTMGGSINYIGKRMNYQITKQENLLWGWPAKLTNSLGTSICINAIRNDDFLENLHLEFGFTRFNYNTKSKEFTPQLMPISAFTFTYVIITKNAVPDLKNSFLLGNIILKSYKNSNVLGAVRGSIMWINTQSNDLKHISHENIHIFQYEQFNAFNNIYSKIKYLDCKYIYIENTIIKENIYRLCNIKYKNGANKYSNIFELEAYSISEHQYFN